MPLSLANLKRPAPGFLCSGQPTALQLREAKAAGVTRIIDFRTPAEDHGLDEPAEAAALGIQYHNLPVAGPEDLTRAMAQKLDALLSENCSGETLLHCGSGNRVGGLMALRAGWIEGKPVDEAIATGEAWGMMPKLEPYVRQLLEKRA